MTPWRLTRAGIYLTLDDFSGVAEEWLDLKQLLDAEVAASGYSWQDEDELDEVLYAP